MEAQHSQAALTPVALLAISWLAMPGCSKDAQHVNDDNITPRRVEEADARPPEEVKMNGDKVPSSVDTSDDLLLADLTSPDEGVRARAATALHQRRHPRALEACLATLDDAADVLHVNITPAVFCLAEIGDPALVPLFERMGSTEEITRLHAQEAVVRILKRHFGFDGREWAPGALDRWFAWWKEIGYDPRGDAATRAAAIGRLRAWQTTELRE